MIYKKRDKENSFVVNLRKFEKINADRGVILGIDGIH